MKSLNELMSRLRLSMEEEDFGESTFALLSNIEEEGGHEICIKLKTAFLVTLFNINDIILIFLGFLQKFARVFGAVDRPFE